MLLAMFCDDSPTIRKLGWKRIQKARLARKYDQCGKDKRKKMSACFEPPKLISRLNCITKRSILAAFLWRSGISSPPILKNMASGEFDA